LRFDDFDRSKAFASVQIPSGVVRQDDAGGDRSGLEKTVDLTDLCVR
jgi:hypothetical protein